MKMDRERQSDSPGFTLPPGAYLSPSSHSAKSEQLRPVSASCNPKSTRRGRSPRTSMPYPTQFLSREHKLSVLRAKLKQRTRFPKDFPFYIRATCDWFSSHRLHHNLRTVILKENFYMNNPKRTTSTIK